ncbi:MAG: hypothetical protein NTY74_09285 [Ignavibacteriae bacterium]|nr:hypothetical protein [Ignavibacteriota bacterium]
MKTVLFALFVLFVTLAVQPCVNVSFAQDNCTCAECGYACKTPMVHASNCKYRNKRQSEESAENKVEVTSETKSLKIADDTFDSEYEMLMLQFKAKMVAADANIDAQQKEKQINEIKGMMGKLTPATEEQKMMYDDIMKELGK